MLSPMYAIGTQKKQCAAMKKLNRESLHPIVTCPSHTVSASLKHACTHVTLRLNKQEKESRSRDETQISRTEAVN